MKSIWARLITFVATPPFVHYFVMPIRCDLFFKHYSDVREPGIQAGGRWILHFAGFTRFEFEVNKRNRFEINLSVVLDVQLGAARRRSSASKWLRALSTRCTTPPPRPAAASQAALASSTVAASANSGRTGLRRVPTAARYDPSSYLLTFRTSPAFLPSILESIMGSPSLRPLPCSPSSGPSVANRLGLVSGHRMIMPPYPPALQLALVARRVRINPMLT